MSVLVPSDDGMWSSERQIPAVSSFSLQVSLTVRFVQITFYLKEIEGQIISWCNLCISELGVIKY